MTEQWQYLVTNSELEDIITAYCNDFTQLAKAGRFGPISGRDREVDETILILLQKGRNNAG